MPLAGLVLNRVHGSGAAQLSAERALAAAENLDERRIVDQDGGKAGLRNSPDTYGSSDHVEPSAPASTSGPGSPATEAATERADDTAADTAADGTAAADAAAGDAADGTRASERPDGADRGVDELTAGLLRLHAERMQLLSRERRTRDRFTALHPEVAVAEVAALPGDVHDLAGLRDIGNRLAANRPELPESSEGPAGAEA
jgi:hypothetical protein